MNDYIIYPKQLSKRTVPVERNHCFFLMPFSKEYDVIYGTIKQYLNDNNYICTRADEIDGSVPIVTKILIGIAKSQYVIVDLTECNANVFYELGIAHMLKEARNVILLKQKNYTVPFDIRHLTYTEYDPSNLKYISSVLCKFLDESKIRNEFYEAIRQHGLINYIDDNNQFVELVLSSLDDATIDCLTQNLLIDGLSIDDSSLDNALSKYRKLLDSSLSQKNCMNALKLLNIYYEELSVVRECDYIRGHVNQLLNTYFEQFDLEADVIMDYKTRLALLLAKKELYMDIVLPWILNYFSRSKSTTIDLNRYSVEHFLMTSKSLVVDEAIVNSLCHPDCYVREHMSDIIGEKNITFAAPLLFTQLAKEKNVFTAQSMMEAIGKIKADGGIYVIIDWIKNHKEELIRTNQLFVLKHAYNAISRLDTTPQKVYIANFNNEFGDILEDYYIM